MMMMQFYSTRKLDSKKCYSTKLFVTWSYGVCGSFGGLSYGRSFTRRELPLLLLLYLQKGLWLGGVLGGGAPGGVGLLGLLLEEEHVLFL